jgi:hypothetical protein
MMISYAQNFEDVILNRVCKDMEKGFYVDVGAYDPSTNRSPSTSTTKAGRA